MSFRRRFWAIFFGVLATWVGGWLILAAGRESTEKMQWLARLAGAVPTLLGLRLIFAGLSGRMPEWISSLADAD